MLDSDQTDVAFIVVFFRKTKNIPPPSTARPSQTVFPNVRSASSHPSFRPNHYVSMIILHPALSFCKGETPLWGRSPCRTTNEGQLEYRRNQRGILAHGSTAFFKTEPHSGAILRLFRPHDGRESITRGPARHRHGLAPTVVFVLNCTISLAVVPVGLRIVFPSVLLAKAVEPQAVDRSLSPSAGDPLPGDMVFQFADLSCCHPLHFLPMARSVVISVLSVPGAASYKPAWSRR